MKFIAVDFDGTLCINKFPKIGKVNAINRKVHEVVKQLKSEGHILILWTCREDGPNGKYLKEAIEWCKTQGLEFDYINENPESPWGDTKRKIYADLYIDDKSINPNI